LAIAAQASALTLGVGWSPSSTEAEMLQVQKSGAEMFRVPLPPEDDGVVGAAAEHGVKIDAVIGGGSLPADTATFVSKVEAEVRSYGCEGSFWSNHPQIPYDPVVTWEILIEPNAAQVPATDFGQFVSTVANAIHSASKCGSTEVLAGGLLIWGNSTKAENGKSSLQGSVEYLAEAYPYFASNSAVTGVAIHPYELNPSTFYTPPGGTRYSAIEAFK
jgi:hypothetical protein